MKHEKHEKMYLLNTKYNPVVFRKCDIAAGLKATKCGKACYVDGLAAEHIHADDLILVILSIVFNDFMNHVFLPDNFMKSAIAPITKTKTRGNI